MIPIPSSKLLDGSGVATGGATSNSLIMTEPPLAGLSNPDGPSGQPCHQQLKKKLGAQSSVKQLIPTVDGAKEVLPVGGQAADSQVEGGPVYEHPGGRKVITVPWFDQLKGDPAVKEVLKVSGLHFHDLRH